MKKTETELAKHEISTAVQEALKLVSAGALEAATVIASSADKASGAIASAALDATKLVASQASYAAKVVTTTASDVTGSAMQDHNLIIKLDTKMDALSDQIKELKDNNSRRIDQLETEKLNCRDSYPVLYKKDVEERLNDLDRRISKCETNNTRFIAYGVSAIFAIGIIQFIVSYWFKNGKL